MIYVKQLYVNVEDGDLVIVDYKNKGTMKWVGVVSFNKKDDCFYLGKTGADLDGLIPFITQVIKKKDSSFKIII